MLNQDQKTILYKYIDFYVWQPSLYELEAFQLRLSTKLELGWDVGQWLVFESCAIPAESCVECRPFFVQECKNSSCNSGPFFRRGQYSVGR